MAITKTIVDDKIEIVTEFKHLQISQATIIKEDGTELNRSFHRRMVQCGTIDSSDNFVDADISSETTVIYDMDSPPNSIELTGRVIETIDPSQADAALWRACRGYRVCSPLPGIRTRRSHRVRSLP